MSYPAKPTEGDAARPLAGGAGSDSEPVVRTGGLSQGGTYIFEYVAEDAIGVWSLSRLIGSGARSSFRLSTSCAAAAIAEHAGKRAEKVARRIRIGGSLRRWLAGS